MTYVPHDEKKFGLYDPRLGWNGMIPPAQHDKDDRMSGLCDAMKGVPPKMKLTEEQVDWLVKFVRDVANSQPGDYAPDTWAKDAAELLAAIDGPAVPQWCADAAATWCFNTSNMNRQKDLAALIARHAEKRNTIEQDGWEKAANGWKRATSDWRELADDRKVELADAERRLGEIRTRLTTMCELGRDRNWPLNRDFQDLLALATPDAGQEGGA